MSNGQVKGPMQGMRNVLAKVLFVLTLKDKVTHNELLAIDKELQEAVKSTELLSDISAGLLE